MKEGASGEKEREGDRKSDKNKEEVCRRKTTQPNLHVKVVVVS